jgi:hypothetical protein
MMHLFFREITHSNHEDFGRDTSGTRQIADFLREVANLLPQEINASLSNVLTQLDVDVSIEIDIISNIGSSLFRSRM